ncbi:major facilitator superfamily domain-containing protein [Kockovaella imperatae]|uniref:Major facilitator superfamily domain-containing protein n=1 Tax=Kockovaella imperatae TaxID=4999 RepID=A0A1Y1U8B7_9TREE|nr:major facilitator superfamily domain-containing protein [Kockovaella imperatae]ORX33756.1 major facilitator superfamily domain-containing protein [Kockovaella imperatae]
MILELSQSSKRVKRLWAKSQVRREPQHEREKLIRLCVAKASDYFTLMASGFALVSDGYQNNLPTIFNPIFTKLYGKEIYNSIVSTRVSNALLIGEIIGQLVVGLICDRVGRKTAMVGTTLMIVIGGILATAASGSTPAGMFWMLTVARGTVGVGVGGEYPACSTSASEAANEKFGRDRGKVFILLTNLMLSIGGPIVISLFLLIINGAHYKGTNDASDTHKLQYTWRILMGIGIIIPLSVFYFRLKMMNSKLYRRNALKKSTPVAIYGLVLKRYWKTLIGTAGTWFLYDFVTFPNGIFSSTIIAEVIPGAGLVRTLEWNLLFSILSLPGVFIGAFIVKYTGRRNLLIMGFSGYLIFGLIVGLAFDKIIKIHVLFIILYAFMQSSGNLGPGNMEGTISSESYPTSIRGTCYGISAALGKTGAAIGTQTFRPIQASLGKKYTFIIAACCGVVGVLLAFFFVEDKGKDRLEKEDEAWRQYLVEHGYGDLHMGDGSAADRSAADNREQEKLEF